VTFDQGHLGARQIRDMRVLLGASHADQATGEVFSHRLRLRNGDYEYRARIVDGEETTYGFVLGRDVDAAKGDITDPPIIEVDRLVFDFATHLPVLTITQKESAL
jgi:hypothetical protein